MAVPTKPGQLCKVIGGRSPFNGEGVSPNQGKTVVTMFLHKEQAGIELENVWHCRAKNEEVLQTYYGAGNEADFLSCWLEVAEPDAAPLKTFNTELELTK
jgi:hypothetical protein